MKWEHKICIGPFSTERGRDTDRARNVSNCNVTRTEKNYFSERKKKQDAQDA